MFLPLKLGGTYVVVSDGLLCNTSQTKSLHLGFKKELLTFSVFLLRHLEYFSHLN